MITSDKYGRCLHAHISLGTTSDDRFMPRSGMTSCIYTTFFKTIILTIKFFCHHKTWHISKSFNIIIEIPTHKESHEIEFIVED